jgi:LysM repeat protein
MMPKKETSEKRHPIRRMVSRKTLRARAASREEIDDCESEAEPGMKLSQAFIVVLLLHILAVGGIYAFNQIKSATKADAAEKAPLTIPQEPIAKPASLQEEKQIISDASPSISSVNHSNPLTHTVVAGDTLHHIAGMHGVNIASLEKANSLENNSIIKPGQVLVIPETSKETTVITDKAALVKPVATVVAKAPSTAPIPSAAPEKKEQVSASARTYAVAKGDNPYSIAKKLKVNPIELMKANKIEDPRKLQIGQKLIVP